jgi:hypothetical protein
LPIAFIILPLRIHAYTNKRIMKLRALLLGFCGALLPQATIAQTTIYSPMMTGPLGLNTVPNARMDESGTISGGISTLEPYTHGYLGFQIAKPLYINLRQSAESPNPFQKPERLYPGLDFKLRLLEESRFQPEIVLGMNSAVGHQRFASEYLALSKRYNNFDFTAGLGWGRMGKAGHIGNPLKIFSSHFGKDRPLDGEIATNPEQWFTGDSAAFFAGVEYFTQFDGLSLKADWGGDTYAAESAFVEGFDKPAPWSVGFSYSPRDWINAGIAMQGFDQIMARISFKSNAASWPFKRNNSSSKAANYLRMNPHRAPNASAPKMEIAAKNHGNLLYDTRANGAQASSSLYLAPYRSTPSQLRDAAIAMSNHGGKSIEALTIRPTTLNLKGPAITLNRRDLENALARNNGSAEEIWRSAVIDADNADSNARPVRYKRGFLNFVLDNRFSLAEEDNGILYRTGLIANFNAPSYFGLLNSGTSIRLNLADNLGKLRETRLPSLLPVRSNEYDFADKLLALDRSYFGLTHSFSPELHMAINGGYLEEMYGGFGGEILYRPFGKRFAIGAESWLAMKREPLSALNLGFNGDSLLTGHLNAWYEFPDSDMTLKIQAGRYLAEDLGLGFTLSRNFDNGVKLEGFTTLSNAADMDAFGGTTNAYSGIRMTMPIGGIKPIPDGSSIKITAAPFGRDYGQALDNPMPLYEATEPLSYRHITHYWSDIGKGD